MPQVERICRETRGTKENPFRPSQHYQGVADFRPFGISAILHTTCRHGAGDHKLELIDTGQMSYAGMVNEVERVFNMNPRGLELMRVDLAADVEGVSVPWFQEHMRVKWKRWGCEYGKMEVSRMGHVELQTVYYGKRPNCIRVYNKVAEWQREYDLRKRGAEREGAELPPFEAVYRWPATGRTLTRVERQLGGGRVPAEIVQFGAAPKVLPSFNPFDPIDLAVAGESAAPSPEGSAGIEEWLSGIGLRQIVQDQGMQRARSLLNRHGHRNANRILAKYGRFLPAGNGISATRLREIYQHSVTRQLAA